MAGVIGYEQIILPNGQPGTVIHYDDGLTQTVDVNHQPVARGYNVGALAPLDDPMMTGMTAMTPPPAASAPRMAAPPPARAPMPRMPVAPAPMPAAPPPSRPAISQMYDAASGWDTMRGAPSPSPIHASAPSFTAQMPATGGGGGGGRSAFPTASRTPGGTYRGPGGGGGGTAKGASFYVPGGAGISGGNPQAARGHYPSGGQISSLQHRNGYSPPSDKGSHRSPQYNKMAAKGAAMRGKIQGMAANIRSGGGGQSSGGGASSSGWIPNKYGSSSGGASSSSVSSSLSNAMRKQAIALAGYQKTLARGEKWRTQIAAKPWDPRVVSAETAIADEKTAKDAYKYSKKAYKFTKKANKGGGV